MSNGVTYLPGIVSRFATASPSFSTYTIKDWFFVAFSCVLLVVYELFYLAMYKWYPWRCTLWQNTQNRRRWIQSTLKKKGAEVLVVQTLRNGILAGNFFGGTSATIALFILGQLTEVTGSTATQLWFLCALLFACFFNFLVVIRNYNHLSFMTWNESEDQEYTEFPERKVHAVRISERMIAAATLHHMIGIRCFYFVIVILGWKISTLGMLIAAVFLVPFLAYQDFNF